VEARLTVAVRFGMAEHRVLAAIDMVSRRIAATAGVGHIGLGTSLEPSRGEDSPAIGLGTSLEPSRGEDSPAIGPARSGSCSSRTTWRSRAADKTVHEAVESFLAGADSALT